MKTTVVGGSGGVRARDTSGYADGDVLVVTGGVQAALTSPMR